MTRWPEPSSLMKAINIRRTRKRTVPVLLGIALIMATLMLAGRLVRVIAQNEGSSIAGTVVDEQNSLVSDAKVTLTHQETTTSSLTHADGKFEFKKLFPGQYTLTVEVAGFRKQTVTLVITHPGESLLQAIKLTPSSLHVAVFDAASHQPLGGVSVTLAAGERSAQEAARSTTDEAGDAFFGRLGPGSYRLSASLRGYDDYQSVVFISSGKITTEFALPLTIAPVIPINDRATLRYNVPALPSKNVQAIFQDSQGWIWFGTDKGVARFNGSDFRSSAASGSNYSWLAGLDVRTIAEDEQGAIWLGTSHGIRKVLKDGADAGHLLEGSDIHQILVDEHGNFWVATSNGEYQSDGHDSSTMNQVPGLPSNDTWSTAVDRDGHVYIATVAGVVVLANGQVRPFSIAASGEPSAPRPQSGARPRAEKPEQRGPKQPEARFIFADNNGTLWFATSAGAFYYDGKTVTPVEAEPLRSGAPPGGYAAVKTIGQDTAGRLWFGLEHGGAVLYSQDRREAQKIGFVERDHVDAIFPDREGNIWFGSDDGVIRADLYSFVDFNTNRGLLDNDVRAVIEEPAAAVKSSTRQPRLLFATAGGVSVMDRERLVPMDGFRANIGIRSIAFDRDGAAWFATSRGVFRLGEQSLTQLNEGNGLVSDNVNYVASAEGGSIIALATAKGLSVYKGGALTSVDPLFGFNVVQVVEGPGGRIWCATNRGVAVYDPGSGETTLIDTGRGLLDNDVRWIVANRNQMIIATGGGIQSCVAESSAPDALKNARLDTIDSESARTLLLDHDGYLWAGTDDGQVKKFAHISNQYVSTVYSEETTALDGQAINSFYEDSKGRIWIATRGGAVRHTPVRSAPLARVSVEADGRLLQPQSEPAASFDLPYGASKLVFHFTGVSLDGQVRYLYRMNRQGQDQPWILLPVQQAADREVSISEVPQGAGTFEVMALNRDLYGAITPGAAIMLRIGPPFWRHTWFLLLAFSLLAIGVAVSLAARRRRRREYILPKELRTFVPIEPNPYIVGNPIRTEKMFFGREDDFRYTRAKLEGVSQGVVIVFCGERRVGKSSILYQVLNGRLGERFIPVFVDMQEMVISSDSEFFSRISRLIAEAVSRSKAAAPAQAGAQVETTAAAQKTGQRAGVAVAQRNDAAQLVVPVFDSRNPYPIFLDFLDEVLHAAGDKTVLILVDEYELMESKVDEGKLSHELFTFLAGLMDNKERLSLIFTGSRRLEERDRKYWRELLRRSLFRKVSFLSEKDTVRLVTEPVTGRVVYGRGVIDRIHRLTSGQPFYVQVICQNSVDYLNENRQNWFTLSDLDSVIGEIFDNPLPQMIYAWEGLSDDEKIVLSLLAETLPDDNSFSTAGELRTAVRISSYPVNLSENTIRLTLEEMFRRELLDKDAMGGFRFRMDLFRLWVRHAHSIWQVVNEVRTL